jgi:hypothetical protein
MTTLHPPVRTVIPLDIEIETDSIGVATGTVVLEAPAKDVAINIGALRGPTGLQGPPGPPGSNYRHDQTTPSTIWTAQHNFGHEPGGITVLDEDGNTVLGWTTIHASDNVTILMFPSAETGTAFFA